MSGRAVSQSMSAENINEINCYWKSATIKMTKALSINWLAEDVVVSVTAGVVVSGRAVVESGVVVFPGSGSGSGAVVLGTAVVVSFVFVFADEVFEIVELAIAASVTAASGSTSSAAGVSSDTAGDSVAAGVDSTVLVDPTAEDVPMLFCVVVILLLVAGVSETVVETFVVSLTEIGAAVTGVDEVAATLVVLSFSISVSTVVATGSSMSSGTVNRSISGL